MSFPRAHSAPVFLCFSFAKKGKKGVFVFVYLRRLKMSAATTTIMITTAEPIAR